MENKIEHLTDLLRDREAQIEDLNNQIKFWRKIYSELLFTLSHVKELGHD